VSQRVPGLWLCAQNDRCWAREATRSWHAAASSGVTPPELVMTEPLPDRDGHDLIVHTRFLWQAPVDAFLKRVNLP